MQSRALLLACLRMLPATAQKLFEILQSQKKKKPIILSETGMF
jgi:hypothetical protein